MRPSRDQEREDSTGTVNKVLTPLSPRQRRLTAGTEQKYRLALALRMDTGHYAGTCQRLVMIPPRQPFPTTPRSDRQDSFMAASCDMSSPWPEQAPSA
ncbi:hypothetical protein GMO_19020 [Gluconobacter morbifer G707]|uniref:Uncharacterized protein n=1 Tax=Gluconobacter morbifer G707 TaxID=1088869 RepID=G6XK86_9PROT|nr:hypothetical protein GMO_19020 [Gluconobacter morbifer G707]